MVSFSISPDIRLELLKTAHASEIYALIEANRARLREWLYWVDDTKSRDDVEDYIKSAVKQYNDGLGFQTTIFYRGGIAGLCGFLPLNRKDHIGEIGYWMGAEYEGLGIMTGSVAAVMGKGFGHLGLNRVEIRCAEGNRKSRAVAERLGFTEDGVLRQGEWLYDHYVDLVVYSKLKSEYKVA